ncbi:hypothetical protein Fmac_002684 [Flemingia macrophylla]|uniref:Uncharacterized protein n=1 Tax=Flemingia macrophylla TaxID=520843 RepID=A0ABD1NKN3_9FABA
MEEPSTIHCEGFEYVEIEKPGDSPKEVSQSNLLLVFQSQVLKPSLISVQVWHKEFLMAVQQMISVVASS